MMPHQSLSTQPTQLAQVAIKQSSLTLMLVLGDELLDLRTNQSCKKLEAVTKVASVPIACNLLMITKRLEIYSEIMMERISLKEKLENN